MNEYNKPQKNTHTHTNHFKTTYNSNLLQPKLINSTISAFKPETMIFIQYKPLYKCTLNKQHGCFTFFSACLLTAIN